MRKIFLPVFFIVAAFAAYGNDSVQLNYRGHLRYSDVSSPRPYAVSMTFRIYAAKSDQTAVWSNSVNSVELDAEGFFQVALSGNGLDRVIDSGKAGYIGVTIGDGKEQYPRQQLLFNTWAEQSACAGALTASPSVGTARVQNAEFKQLSVGNISVGGAVSLPVSDQMLTMEVRNTRQDFVLKTKGEVTFFDSCAPILRGTATTSAGGVSFGSAKYNCAAFFTSVGNAAMPGITRLIKNGEDIGIPSYFNLPDGLTVKCWLYPIGK